MKEHATLLIGFHGDTAVPVVGREEPGGQIRTINQFQGKDAEELYEKLVGKE